MSTAGGDVLGETVIESAIDTGPSAVLDTVITELEKLLADSGRDPATVRGVGLGVPGPVDWPTGRIARSISMPGWDDYPVRDHLRHHFGVPAVVDNDANLLGLGEQRRIYPIAHLVVFVKVGTGVGSSVVVDGELLRGSDSAEGDIGHAKIPGVDRDLQQLRGPRLPRGHRQRPGHGARSGAAGSPRRRRRGTWSTWSGWATRTPCGW